MAPLRRALQNVERRLPQGFGDVFRQFGLFFLAYQGYQVVRGLAESREALAFANADRIVDFERSIGLFFEQPVQAAALQHEWIVDFANFLYMNSHFVISVAFLAWLYVFRNQHFYFVRNMFMVAMGLALIGYTVYPTAPPRLFPEYGFVGTLDVFAGVVQDSNSVGVFVNKYAAVPSMHCAFSLMVGWAAFSLVKPVALKALWAIYPLLVFGVVIVTGNHWWMDGAIGWLCVLASGGVAVLLARARPAVWAFRPARTATETGAAGTLA